MSGSSWTVTFNSPISNLKLYVYWRASGIGGSSFYRFDQAFSIASGSTGMTNSGNDLNISGWGKGILEFSGPITTLTLSADGTSCCSGHTMTFASGAGGIASASGTGQVIRIDSPNLAGIPTAPTATAGISTTQIATTAFVTNAVSAATSGAFVDLTSGQTVAGNKNFTGQLSIGTSNPESSAALDVTSTSQGFLPPRMTKDQRNAIVNKVAGLIVWCNNCGETGELQVYNGTAWTNFIGGATSEPLVVGSSYKGGKIAYIFQSGDVGYVAGEFHGIIASNSDLSNGIRWGQNFDGGTTTYDCVNRHGASGYALPCAIGAGGSNTTLIISANTESSPTDYAALICSNYSVVSNGITYSDWFLPSKDEMIKLYQNKDLIGGLYYDSINTSSKSNWYWTSSGDVFGDRATDVSSNNGSNSRSFRGSLLSVRAVMYF
jgi:hypothetical protein